ncbi:MAG: hypothetical protein LBK76_03425, partial [Verrucomicrobiales bacterium]|nr:hypothetical protein [Verrucomicrobiales bacterium]
NAAWSPVGKVSPLWLAVVAAGAVALTVLGGWVYADAGRACGIKSPPPLTVTGENLRAAADGEGAPVTVSMDERWLSVVMPNIDYTDIEFGTALADLEKVIANHGGAGLKLVVRDLPSGSKSYPFTLKIKDCSLFDVLRYMASLSDYKIRFEGDTAYFYSSADTEAGKIYTSSYIGIQPECFTLTVGVERANVTAQLQQKGVQFGENCHAWYFPRLQKIIMNNTKEQQAVLQQIVTEFHKDTAARLKTRMAATIIHYSRMRFYRREDFRRGGLFAKTNQQPAN